MRKIKDSMVAGLIGGLIGVICMDVSVFLLWRNNKTETLHGHLAGSMIMNPLRLKKKKNFLIGQLFHMTIGSGIGVGMVEILKRYGKDHHNIKGGFLSAATWGILYNFGQKIGFYKTNPHLIKTSYVEILNHLIYGLATSNAIVALSDPSIFAKTKAKEDTQARKENKQEQPSYNTLYSDSNSYNEENLDSTN